MIKDVTETNVIETLLERLKTEDAMMAHSHQVLPTLKAILFGAVKFLANTKFENEAALRLNDKNGTFIAAVVLERAVDDEGKNSFEARIELNEEAVKDTSTIYEWSDEEVLRFLNRFMYTLINNKFFRDEMGYKFIRVAISTVINTLMNVNKNEVDEDGYELKFDEFLTASIVDDNGNRVITMTPEVDLKKFIKDDSLVDVE